MEFSSSSGVVAGVLAEFSAASSQLSTVFSPLEAEADADEAGWLWAGDPPDELLELAASGLADFAGEPPLELAAGASEVRKIRGIMFPI